MSGRGCCDSQPQSAGVLLATLLAALVLWGVLAGFAGADVCADAVPASARVVKSIKNNLCIGFNFSMFSQVRTQ
jgi:hypothetical protein